MKSIVWSHKYGVIQADLDSHHKILYEYIEMLEGLARDNSLSKNTVKDVFRELYKYTRYHFAFEERLMKKYAYPAYIPHKCEHVDFTRRVHEFHIAYLNKGAHICSLFTQFTKSWFVDHIASSDKPLAEYCQGRGFDIEEPFAEYSLGRHPKDS